jgi:hypothetical protein
MLVLPATATPPWWCPGSRRPGWSSGPRCSGSSPGTRPTTRSPRRRARRPAATAAIGDRTWARFLVDLLPPCRHPVPGQRRGRPAPGRKDAAEVDALRAAGAAADRVAAQLQAGEIPLVGRTEAEVSAELGRRLLAEGHHRVNFAIVAAGPNAASPHHEPGEPVIEAGEVVLCDFGGTMAGPGGVGYCSDITRCVAVGAPPRVAEAYAVLHEAQQAAVAGHRRARLRGRRRRRPPHHHRRRLRRVVHPPHRPRHRRRGARGPLHRRGQRHAAGGRATPSPSSPASTRPGRWGIRLEDIVVATDDGPDRPQPGRPRPRRRRRLSPAPHDRARRRHRSACSGPPAGCCSCGSPPAGARSASATAG